MSRIFWDTNLFVYLFEDKGALTERVVSLRERMIDRGDELLTSALTLGEILVKPVEASDDALARRYEQGPPRLSPASAVIGRFHHRMRFSLHAPRWRASIFSSPTTCVSVERLCLASTSYNRSPRQRFSPGEHTPKRTHAE